MKLHANAPLSPKGRQLLVEVRPIARRVVGAAGYRRREAREDRDELGVAELREDLGERIAEARAEVEHAAGQRHHHQRGVMISRSISARPRFARAPSAPAAWRARSRRAGAIAA